MTLTDLVHYLGQGTGRCGTFDETLSFTGVSQDSRNVKMGDVFVVVSCDLAESNARAAIKAGAVALVAELDFVDTMKDKLNVPFITVVSARRAYSQLSVLLYPGQPETIVAVTGTNGKSSVVTAVRQIWQKLGYAAASFGTLGLDLSYQAKVNIDIPLTKLTTPDALIFHQTLNTLAESHVTHCVFEASSHGLDQFRLHGARLTAAGFTNLSQDHLDYHETMDAYFEAKTKLFLEVLPADKTAVINVDSAYFSALKAMITGRGQTILSYGVDQEADLVARNIRLFPDKILMDLTFQGETWSDIPLNMVGAFQVENVLCAMGLILATGVPASSIVAALPSLCSAPGRMELVGKTSQGGSIYIDYAHTPDALSRALTALRKHVTGKGRLRVVFGCGGNRDAGKRVQMGEIAHTLADDVYVTDDNPRDEDPAFIRAQILVACPKATEVADRHQAIRTAINHMSSNDVLLIAGKGHEHGQIIGDRVVPFDDRTEAQAILKEGVAA